MKNRHALVLLSGGVDSTLCAMMARRSSLRVSALTVDYGQPFEELRAAREVAASLTVEHHTVRTDIVRATTSPPGCPPTYVPARNTVLLALALGIAETINATQVYIGVNGEDRDYPDCRPEYFLAWDHLALVATSFPMRVVAPLMNASKQWVVTEAKRMGAPLHLTWSCLAPTDGRQCGQCRACLELEAAHDRVR
jgi:7-cyano-7-deazaguanine synthase